jgi:acetoin utilization deacetylase AcuC-like enzyme
VHDPRHLDAIAATAGRRTMLDPDTHAGPRSHEVALLAAGAGIDAVDHALAGRGPGVALVRPPGHHAERARAMGFCLYNNAAVMAAHARARGVERVAVVDYDVHHGNGTQWIFWEDPAVLYVSTHQFPFYPGTGAATETGAGRGSGFTLNVPLAEGAGDADYELVFQSLVLPVLRAFRPALLVISAGFDAHERDPLAGMRMSTAGYAALTAHLRDVGAPVALTTEGGYDLAALESCLDEALRVLGGGAAAPPEPPDAAGAQGRAAVRAVRAAQGALWPALGRV